jgi:kinesin family protein 26
MKSPVDQTASWIRLSEIKHFGSSVQTFLFVHIHNTVQHSCGIWSFQFSGGSAGSGGSSGEEAAAIRLQQAQENGRSTGSSDVDPSSSEQSADTVIYVGPSDDAATDGEHPPVYIPSLNSGDNRCAMGKALRGSSAEHRVPSKSGGTHQSKSAPLSPAKSTSTQSKLPNGSVVEDRSSPSHRSSLTKSTTNQLNSKTASPSHNSSCKSSPVRTPSKTTPHKTAAALSDQQLSNSTQSQNSSKIPVPFSNTCANAAGIVSGSDEQWIDGPRISKSKVAEARILLKDSHKKKETWIDGPLQTAKLPTLGNGHASGSYGFMDSHKKSMIRKWVENQTVQIQRQAVKHSTSTVSQRPPTTGAPQGHTYKELTVFKTCEDEETEMSGVCVKSSFEVEPQSNISKDETVSLDANKESEVTPDVKYSGTVEKIEDSQRSNEKISSEMEADRPGKQDMTIADTELEHVEEDDDVVGDMPPPLQLFQPHNKEISTGMMLLLLYIP